MCQRKIGVPVAIPPGGQGTSHSLSGATIGTGMCVRRHEDTNRNRRKRFKNEIRKTHDDMTTNGENSELQQHQVREQNYEVRTYIRTLRTARLSTARASNEQPSAVTR